MFSTGLFSEALVLDLDKCLDLAYKNNPNYLSLSDRSEAFSARRSAAFRDFLPTMSVDLVASEDVKSAGDDYSASVSLTQTLYKGGSIYNPNHLSSK